MHNITDTNKSDKMSESTVSDEKPKRGSVAPSGDAFRIRPTNWLMPMMLLSIREWDSYGYELMERARTLGFEKMNPGTLYRALRQMEKDGDVESSWETSRGGAGRPAGCTPSRTPARPTWASGRSPWGNTSSPWTPFYGSMRVSRRIRTRTRLASRGPRRIFHPLSGRRPDLEATLAPDAWPALACADLS